MNFDSIRRVIARVFWRFSPWRLVREASPVPGARILIGAPHTSNIDFVLMLAISWEAGMRIHWLGKKELFRGIAGPIMRGLGGIAVDRSSPSSIVTEVLERARTTENFMLVVTPEGTRSGKGWRSGFYRIATLAGLPVTLGFVDRTTRTTGVGPTIHLTGDVESDMDRIREFYADKSGARPHLRTEPRLNDEAGLTRQLTEPGEAPGF